MSEVFKVYWPYWVEGLPDQVDDLLAAAEAGLQLRGVIWAHVAPPTVRSVCMHVRVCAYSLAHLCTTCAGARVYTALYLLRLSLNYVFLMSVCVCSFTGGRGSRTSSKSYVSND